MTTLLRNSSFTIFNDHLSSQTGSQQSTMTDPLRLFDPTATDSDPTSQSTPPTTDGQMKYQALPISELFGIEYQEKFNDDMKNGPDSVQCGGSINWAAIPWVQNYPINIKAQVADLWRGLRSHTSVELKFTTGKFQQWCTKANRDCHICHSGYTMYFTDDLLEQMEMGTVDYVCEMCVLRAITVTKLAELSTKLSRAAAVKRSYCEHPSIRDVEIHHGKEAASEYMKLITDLFYFRLVRLWIMFKDGTYHGQVAEFVQELDDMLCPELAQVYIYQLKCPPMVTLLEKSYPAKIHIRNDRFTVLYLTAVKFDKSLTKFRNLLNCEESSTPQDSIWADTFSPPNNVTTTQDSTFFSALNFSALDRKKTEATLKSHRDSLKSRHVSLEFRNPLRDSSQNSQPDHYVAYITSSLEHTLITLEKIKSCYEVGLNLKEVLQNINKHDIHQSLLGRKSKCEELGQVNQDFSRICMSLTATFVDLVTSLNQLLPMLLPDSSTVNVPLRSEFIEDHVLQPKSLFESSVSNVKMDRERPSLVHGRREGFRARFHDRMHAWFKRH